MIQLRRGGDSLVVAPESGGSIVGWIRDGRHLLRRPSPDSVLRGHPGAMGCFPLVPYCNRIAHRRFTWDGQEFDLAANFGDHPHAIHGVGWQRPWRVEGVSADAVTLSLRHDATGASAHAWPFAFDARITYQLTGASLSMRLEATNRHAARAPMGLGAHPYFPRATDASIAFEAESVWLNRDALPFSHEPVPAAWDHTEGRRAAREPLDHCFTGWRGEARLPESRIAADPVFANLQVFTPANADFFCVEPVSHVPDAINRPDLPHTQAMTVLAPGESLGGSILYTPVETIQPR
jgi:aldose 1-epimerase